MRNPHTSNRPIFRRWRRIAIAGCAGFRRRFGIVGATVAMIVMTAWFLALKRFPEPQDEFTHRVCRIAMFSGMATMFAQFHGMANLRSRFALPVVVCSAICFGFGAWALIRDPSAGIAARLGLPVLSVAMAMHYVFGVSVFRGRFRSSTLRVGDRFPDFELPDTRHRAMRLGSVLNGQPALLVFYKGDW